MGYIIRKKISIVCIICFVGLLYQHLSAQTKPNSDDINTLISNFDDEFKIFLTEVKEVANKEIITFETISSVHRKIDISGSHFDFGYLIGLIWNMKFGKLETTESQQTARLNDKMIELYEEIYPQHLELLEGVASASDLSLRDLDLGYMEYMYFTVIGWLSFKYPDFKEKLRFTNDWNFTSEHCSGASYYVQEENRQFAGRNLDLEWEQPHFIVHHNLEGSYKSISNCLSNPFNSTLDGINEKGLFIMEATNNYPVEYNRSQGNDHPGVPAVHNIHLIHIVLQTCATVDEAVELIKKTPIWFSTWVSHYLISDASGKSVVVEYDLDYTPVFFYTEKPYHVVTNSAYQKGHRFINKNCNRFKMGTKKLRQQVNNPSDMFEVMKVMRSDGISKTLWTTIADLSGKTIEVYFRTEDFKIAHTFSFGEQIY